MNVITRRTIRTAIGFFAVGVLALALAGPAIASHLHVRPPGAPAWPPSPSSWSER